VVTLPPASCSATMEPVLRRLAAFGFGREGEKKNKLGVHCVVSHDGARRSSGTSPTAWLHLDEFASFGHRHRLHERRPTYPSRCPSTSSIRQASPAGTSTAPPLRRTRGFHALVLFLIGKWTREAVARPDHKAVSRGLHPQPQASRLASYFVAAAVAWAAASTTSWSSLPCR
jgi:hypothetical protein